VSAAPERRTSALPERDDSGFIAPDTTGWA
jgi:hypothetical protein